VNNAVTSTLNQVLASSPLRHPPFRTFYMASVGVALGYTMQATMAAWLMAVMTPSEVMVALVQTASTAPSIIFGLVAGALSDIIERRHVIVATQIAFLAGTIVLSIATKFGFMAPSGLLVLTFLIGIAFAFYMPAQSASINDLVERRDVPKAVALGAVAMNVSRAIGPAIAGALMAWIGSDDAFLSCAVCFIGMIFVVRSWPRVQRALPGVPESLMTGIASGIRYARHSSPLRAILVRNFTFALCASSLYALLPVIARDQLHLGPGGFGILFGSFGAGAVVAALNIPRALGKHSLQRMVLAASLLFVISATLVAASEHQLLAMVGAFGAGASWVGVFASLGAGTQSAAPAWVRARAVAMGFVTVQTAIAAGSVLWGLVASWQGTRIALLAAAATFLVLLGLHRRVRVRLGGDKDIMLSDQIPALGLSDEPEPEDGPVLIQIEYRIDPDNRDAFLRAVRAIGPVRRRNGANSWRVFRDLAEEGLFVERYIISSWAEYVRLRSRMTIADRHVQQEAEKHQREGVPVRVSRFLGVDLPEVRSPQLRTKHPPT